MAAFCKHTKIASLLDQATRFFDQPAVYAAHGKKYTTAMQARDRKHYNALLKKAKSAARVGGQKCADKWSAKIKLLEGMRLVRK